MVMRSYHRASLSKASPGESSVVSPRRLNWFGEWAIARMQCPPDTSRTRYGNGILGSLGTRSMCDLGSGVCACACVCVCVWVTYSCSSLGVRACASM